MIFIPEGSGRPSLTWKSRKRKYRRERKRGKLWSWRGHTITLEGSQGEGGIKRKRTRAYSAASNQSAWGRWKEFKATERRAKGRQTISELRDHWNPLDNHLLLQFLSIAGGSWRRKGEWIGHFKWRQNRKKTGGRGHRG